MSAHYSLVGPNLFMDTCGKLFSKQAEAMVPVKNKFTAAEDRFVANQMKKGVTRDEKTPE